MFFWMTCIAASVALLAIGAGGGGQDWRFAYAHMAVAALVSVAFALIAIRETRALAGRNASRHEIAAVSAQFMGLVWSWCALALLTTYATGILSWKEWWLFFIAAAIVAGLCLFFAATLKKDATSGSDDETLLTLGRYLSMLQLGGMIVVVIGLLVDGKMTRFLNPRPGWEDWAANNIFFFGAIALAAISAAALKGQSRKPGP
ncbi:MAG TPA: hypothetical protein VMX97_14690 [Hyphomicrobiaceae bacterium]|nr:hypothetical protein [Hyphomicrobiaceae bacterium]